MIRQKKEGKDIFPKKLLISRTNNAQPFKQWKRDGNVRSMGPPPMGYACLSHHTNPPRTTVAGFPFYARGAQRFPDAKRARREHAEHETRRATPFARRSRDAKSNGRAVPYTRRQRHKRGLKINQSIPVWSPLCLHRHASCRIRPWRWLRFAFIQGNAFACFPASPGPLRTLRPHQLSNFPAERGHRALHDGMLVRWNGGENTGQEAKLFLRCPSQPAHWTGPSEWMA